MEIDVTGLVDGLLDPWSMSGSVATHGSNAGQQTWRAAKEAAKGLRPEGFTINAAKQWAADFGAWSADEIKGWSRQETLALVLQYASGDLQELQKLAPGDGLGGIDWNAAESLAQSGTCSGNLFVSGDRLYIYLE